MDLWPAVIPNITDREIYFFESSISQTYMDFVKNEVGIGPMVTP